MAGQSPLSMMRSSGRRPRQLAAGRGWRRRPWLVVAPVAIVIVLALGWVWLWYYAASIADASLSGWIDREALAGRVYGCVSQTIGGFPFRIEARCASPVAEIKKGQPQFTVRAENVTFAAEVYHPTLLTGDVTGPLTFAESDKPPGLIANWSRARVRVRGRPPDPEEFAFILDGARFNRAGEGGAVLFAAKHADLQSRIVSGSPRNNPVIETVLHLAAATAPTLHSLVAEPIEAEVDTVLRGFKDLAPKPWAERFREMQAAGGGFDIKFVPNERPDANYDAEATKTKNPNAKIDALNRVAIVGIERIVPLLGIDRMIGRGIDRLSGSDNAAHGLGALDRLMPGLGGALRDTANASMVDNLKKMGQPTEVDKKPAIVLPLRFSDGSVYLGMLPLGELPPLF